MRAVSDGIDMWAQSTGKRDLCASIVLTDSEDFANEAVESNDIVVLVKPGQETV